jgi:hypothetical protein
MRGMKQEKMKQEKKVVCRDSPTDKAGFSG